MLSEYPADAALSPLWTKQQLWPSSERQSGRPDDSSSTLILSPSVWVESLELAAWAQQFLYDGRQGIENRPGDINMRHATPALKSRLE